MTDVVKRLGTLIAHARDSGMKTSTLEDAKREIERLRTPAPLDRGNYEDRHPNDMVLHPLSEIREWDEALAVLGIQDSDQTPAEAIRELNAEIERLRGAVGGPSNG